MKCKRFLIMSTRRVGSTALSLMLDRIEQLECLGEMIFRGKYHPAILPKHIVVSDKTNIHALLTPKPSCQKGIKFTIPDYQANDMDSICELVKNKNLHVVHLTRSLLEQFVSLKVAQKSDVWHISGNQDCQSIKWVGASKHKSVLQKIDTNIGEISDFCKRALKVDQAIAGLAGHNPYFHIDHANLSCASTLSNLSSFLGCKGISSTETGLANTIEGHRSYLAQIEGAYETFEYFETARHHD